MSWKVEQSESTSCVNVNGDTVTCSKDGYYGSPINVLYKDPAEKNGDYFWEIHLESVDDQGGSSVSVGLTDEKSFQPGWGLKAMKYLGNLSDGSGLLVSKFGDCIKQGDKVGILLRLSNEDLKMFIYHNDRPLGLAFHIQAPYPKPLYPVVGFSGNGKVKITRSQRIPASTSRQAEQFTGVEGHWKISNYSQHPECVDCHFEIKRSDDDQNTYEMYGRVINGLRNRLEHNTRTNQWKSGPVLSTLMGGPPELMRKEGIISKLMSEIQHLDVEGSNLIIRTSSGEQVRLERHSPSAPATVTQNIFNPSY